jgi:hypothetical protein
MDFQTETFHQYFTESWKIFTGNATITNILTDGNISSVFYRELQNIYCKCHNHRRLYMSRGGRDVVWRQWRLSVVPPGVRCRVLERVFEFNHKIMIKVQESPPNIMVSKNLWSARVWVRDWLCRGKTHHPQCTLPKVSCIVVWLSF